FWMLSRIQKCTNLKFVDGWANRVDRLVDISNRVVDSRTALYAWSKIRPMIRSINQCELNLGRGPRISSLPPHAIPLGEMLDYTGVWRWQQKADYRPPNLRTALDRTFTHVNPHPIPIVGEDGEPLDWIRNEKDRADLEIFIPEQYKQSFNDTVKH